MTTTSSASGLAQALAPGEPAQPRRLTALTRVVLLIAVYFAGGLLGKEASFLSGQVALVWPPAGIALAAILLFGYRFWPGVALGAVLFSCVNGMPFGFFTFGTAVGNTIGALVCVLLLRRALLAAPSLERTRDVVLFIGLSCFLGTTVNAAFNVVGLAYAGEVKWDDLFIHVLVWWVPNALAGIVVTPFLVAWLTQTSVRWKPRLVIEALVCLTGLTAGTFVSFNSWFVHGIENYPLAFLPYPFLVWSALRFGQRGATTGTLLVSALAIHSLLRGHGPFVTQNEVESLKLIGGYIGILAITNMLLAAAACELRVAEQAVSQSERRYRAVVEDQTDLICRFRPDGMLTFANGACCRFHGRPARQLLGENFLTGLSREDSEVLLRTLDDLSEDRPVLTFDRKVMTGDGVGLWQQYSIRRLTSEDGETVEYQAVIQDITHRKRSEEDLRASEAKYRSLVSNIPDVVWSANSTGRITYVTDNVAQVLGFTQQEIVNGLPGTFRHHVHPNDLPHLEQAVLRLFSEGQKLDLEFRFRRTDGQWIWLHSRASISRLEARRLQAEGILSDITRRKQDEEALKHTKEIAEAANRAKSQFLANMSHELRTPLNAIIGFSEILGDQTFGGLNERQLRYANNILNSGRHLLQLINDILDLSKVEAGRLELARAPFELGKVLQDVQAIVRTLANKKNIQLAIHLPAGLPLLHADEARFKQILFNLLSNAIKFTPDGGRVDVEASLQQTIDEPDSGPRLRMVVRDTGIGVSPDDQERIFREFEQVDSSYGRQQQGTGLGLALTRRLVELHGGGIWVESEGIEGRGSAFSFELPLQPPSDSAEAAPASPMAEVESHRPITVVLAPKSSRLERLLDYLTEAGYDHAAVANTAELAARLGCSRPFAVIVDAGLLAGDQAGTLSAELAALIRSVPAVTFSVDVSGQIGFSRARAGGKDSTPHARLIDAVRPGRPSTGSEVKTVLLVEDDEAFLALLAQTLVQRGFHVLQASCGGAGLDLAVAHCPAVIVLDLNLPDMEGREVAARLRSHHVTRNIPVLIQTGTVLNEEERLHLAADVQGITSKSEPMKLLTEVERLNAHALVDEPSQN